ncbi:MAG: DUF2807 domain-containing protein [Bacteroidota bacterium]
MLKIWKPIAFIVGFALIIGLVAMWVGLIIGFILSVPFANFVFGSPFMAVLGAANIFFIVALPIIGAIQFAARYIFKKKTSASTRGGMLVFWILNLISFFSIGSFIARDFNQQDEYAQAVKDLNFTSDTIRLELGKETGSNSLIDIDGVRIVDDNLIVENVDIDFEKSNDGNWRLLQTHTSRGRNSAEIEALNKAITYEPIIREDKIIIPRDFAIQSGNKWRGQGVKLILEVPEGKTISFGSEQSNRLSRFINHLAQRDRKIPSVRWDGEHIWTMQEKGWYSQADAIKEIKSDTKIKPFKKVIVKGEVKVEIEKGNLYDVTISGKERQLKAVKMEQVKDILEVVSSSNRRGSSVVVKITAPDLERIDLEYTNEVRITNFDGKKLDVYDKGSNEVSVFVEVDSLYLNFRRNKSDIRGKGEYLKVKLDNSARMNAEYYSAQNAFVTADNAGTIRLEVLDTLRTDLTNGSRMQYEDDPTVVINEREERRKKEQAARTAERANRQ